MNNRILRNLITLSFIVFFVVSLIWTYGKITSPSSNVTNGNITQTVNVGVPATNTSQADKININTCSKEALESLPDIGEVLAGKIIDGRPYQDVYELAKIKGIGNTIIQAIKDEVVVK